VLKVPQKTIKMRGKGQAKMSKLSLGEGLGVLEVKIRLGKVCIIFITVVHKMGLSMTPTFILA
jgi:hypothetical protein